MKRIILGISFLGCVGSISYAGFHFGLGKAAAKKSAEVIEAAVKKSKETASSGSATTPTLSLSARTISANSANNITVGSLSASDSAFTVFTLTDNAGGRFKISGSALQVADGSQIVYQNASSYSVLVEASDGSRSISESFTIFVTPTVDLSEGTVITVSTTSDSENGDTSSVSALIASPGPDGISLREAITASNNTAGPETIEFASSLSGATINVASTSVGLALIGGVLIINGDIDGDGNPDITLNGSLGQLGSPMSQGLTVISSSNTIYAMNIVGFKHSGINLKPGIPAWVFPQPPSSDPVLYGNKIVGNVIEMSSVTVAGIQMEQQGWGVEASSKGWVNTLVSSNRIEGNGGENGIHFLTAIAGAKGNTIIDSVIVNNYISGVQTGITVFGGDTTTEYPAYQISTSPVQYSDNNLVKNVVIADNVIETASITGVSVSAANLGNRGNVIKEIKIVGNTIRLNGTIRVEGLSLYTVTPDTGSRLTTNNQMNNFVLSHNVIRDVRIGIAVGPVDYLPGTTRPNEEVISNTLDTVLIRRNRIQNYQQGDIVVFGLVTNLTIE